MVRNAAPIESRGAYDRSPVGRTLEAHIAAVDEEIRALLIGADPSLQPFYGMMLYHLVLDAEPGRYRAMAAKKTGALFAAAAQGAALLATDDTKVREALARFGDAFGQAFQAYDDVLGIWASTERTGKVEMNDLTKRKKTLPVVVGFERAQGKTRERLAALFAPPAPLSSESAEQIREILDELGVRALIDAEIESQRGRAVHALSGIAPIVAAREPLEILEQLVASTTGADEP